MEVHVDDLTGFLVDAQAAERERDTAGCRVGVVGRRVERLRPVGFGRFDPGGALAVLDYMIERAKATGALVRVISTETNEGKQFFEGFGGLAALLRYKA